MTQAFLTYIKSIALYLAFYSIIQLIMPRESFRRYVNILLGLIMIALIVKPVSELINTRAEINLDIMMSQYKLERNTIQRESNIYEKQQLELVIASYRQRLNEQVEYLVAKNSGYAVGHIYVDIVEDTNAANFAAVKAIFIDLTENATNTIPVSEINNLEIKISDFYNMSSANIHIKVK